MKRTALSAAILLATTPVLADTPEATNAQILGTVQVTASRIAQTVDETLSSVSVIERDEIERLQPKQFTDLLEGRAGIKVGRNGPFGKTTSVFTRGTNSDHTLLLVDGVRMGSATLGSPSWQFLPPSEIERVEIVRGPRTSVYGSDAIGGVIQVFSRTGRKGPPRVNAFVGGGSFNTREAGASVAGGTDKTTYSASFSHFDTDGIDVQDGVGDDSRDGYRNTSVSAKASHRLHERLELFGNVLYSRGNTEFDGFIDETDFEHAALRGGLRFSPVESWSSEIALAHSRDENDNFANGAFSSTFDTRRDQIDWRNDLRIGERSVVVAGLDAYDDRVDSTTDFDEDSRYNVGGYAILQTGAGVHDFEFSLRHEENEQFGSETTGQIAWGAAVAEGLRLRASGGTAFKAPSFNQLYFPGFGNPDLEPEDSRSFELGARYDAGQWHADVALFRTRIDDLIVNVPGPNGLIPDNFDEARIRGVEVETGYRVGAWQARASVTVLDTEDRATGNELPRRAPATGRLDIDRSWEELSLGATLVARSRSFNDAGNTERLAGHATVDLRASYAVAPEWTLEGSVQNLFDRDSVLARNSFQDADYNTPGRAAFVKLRYQQR